jgi:hypothetical protein
LLSRYANLSGQIEDGGTGRHLEMVAGIGIISRHVSTQGCGKKELDGHVATFLLTC